MEYNTSRSLLNIKEYGRHIQKMVDHLLTVEDKQKRQRQANVLIELMGFLNPHLKIVEDYRHKLWDHLFLMSDFKLEVESPYPIPTRESLKARPERIPYPKTHPKHNHLGKHVEVLIEKALAEQNGDKKQGFANTIAYYMKLTYSNWHKELVHDDTIQAELNAITKGELEFNNKPFVKHRTDIRSNRDEYGGGGGGRNNNFRKNFGGRDNRNGSGGRDNRGGGRDNRGGGGGNRDNRDNRNNKKRF